MIPSLLPVGIDPQAIQSDREKRMLAHMKHQSQQPATNLQDHIRSKALKLYQKQSQLRSELVHGVDTSTVLATSTDRKAFKHAKRVSRRDARQAETVEQQQRRGQQESIQTATQSRLNAICQHGSALRHESRLKLAKFAHLGFAVVHYHQTVEKARQKKNERNAKARMRTLKKNHQAAYNKLLGQTKKARLADLLKQTDAFLQSLTKPDVARSQDDLYLQQHTVSCADDLRTTHYQAECLQWMISLYNNNQNGILAEDMGLGKTIQIISLITYLIENKQQQGPFLIIAPLP